MKNLSLLLFFSLVIALPSCTKDSVQEPQDQLTTHYIYDWATGEHIASLTPVKTSELEDRAPDTYFLNMSDATTKFGFQANIFIGLTQIYTGPWTWITIPPDTSYVLGFNGDNGNEYLWRVNFRRKLPSVPCSMNLIWSNTCEGPQPSESFTIGPSGTQRTHTFLACE